MTANKILLYLEGVKPQGRGWVARCPAHDDSNPSLKIDTGSDGNVLLHCFAGCSYESILSALGMLNDTRVDPASVTVISSSPGSETERQAAVSGLDQGPPSSPDAVRNGGLRETAYEYEDEHGRLLFQVVRREGLLPDGSITKRFIQRRRPRSGELPAQDGWVYNLEGVPRALYNLRAIGASRLIHIVEGEKDVETLRGLGRIAVCNPGGAGKWRPEYNEHFRGKVVAILPDNDEPGRRHAEAVAALLYGIAEEVLLIEIPGLPPKGDVTDFINAGGTVDDLIDLVESAQQWQPTNSAVEEGREELVESDPTPILPEAALYGVAGQIVRAIAPHTEADPSALLFQLLAAFGCLAGRGAWFTVEATRHYPKLFIALVGASSKARKGTSWSHILGLMTRVFFAFPELVHDGLSSGEGLIYHVRDSVTKKQQVKKGGRVVDYQDVLDDEGALEKRLFVQEPEFARVLTVMPREGNTLSAVLRQAWDSDRLRTMTKTPLKASEAHVTIAAHITLEELRRTLEDTETSNGFANRFLWVFVCRSRLLPFGGSLTDADLNAFVESVRMAYEFAKDVGEVRMNSEARDLWCEVYPRLSEGRPGLFGSVTSRSEAQVIRLAIIYALLDRSPEILREHLRAALAAWEYCSDSARFIFGRRTGDKVADKILAALRDSEAGLTRTNIRDLFGRNKEATAIDEAIRVLTETGLVTISKDATGGRSAERVMLRTYDKNDRSV